jgi:hypothetical protein
VSQYQSIVVVVGTRHCTLAFLLLGADTNALQVFDKVGFQLSYLMPSCPSGEEPEQYTEEDQAYQSTPDYDYQCLPAHIGFHSSQVVILWY